MDQKWSASNGRAGPPEADVVAPLGHLAGDFAVVRLPGVVKTVRSGQRDVEQKADQDDEQAAFDVHSSRRGAKRGARADPWKAPMLSAPVAARNQHLWDHQKWSHPPLSPSRSVSLTFSSCAESLATWDRSRRFRSCSAGCGVSSTGATTRPAWRSSAPGAPRCCAAAASWPGSRRWLARETPEGTLGIGHTRWATHGPPERGQRPPAQGGQRRRRSQRHHRESPVAAGARWRRLGESSLRETDTEIVAHLVDEALLAGAPTWSKACGGRCVRCTAPTRSW